MNINKVLIVLIAIFTFANNVFPSEIQTIDEIKSVDNQLQDMQKIVNTYYNQDLRGMDLEQMQNNMANIYNELRETRKGTQIGEELKSKFQDAEAEAQFANIFLGDNDINQAENTINQLHEKLSELKTVIEERMPSVYFQFKEAEGVMYGLKENSPLLQAPFLVSLEKFQKKQGKDGTEDEPFELEGVSPDTLNMLTQLVTDAISLDTVSDEEIIDIAILANYFQLGSSENQKLVTFASDITERLLEEANGVDLFDTQDIDGLERVAQAYDIQRIRDAIPPVYFKIEGDLYGLRKDHLLLQTDVLQMLQQRAGTHGDGALENPLVLQDVDFAAFEALVRAIQDDEYAYDEEHAFVTYTSEPVDFYSETLKLVDRFLLLDDDRFDRVIFSIAKALKENQDDLHLLGEMQEFAQQIITYEIEKNDYMVSIGGIKTGETFKFGGFQMFFKLLTGETVVLSGPGVELPIYLKGEEEYVDGKKVWEHIVNNSNFSEFVEDIDQAFCIVVTGKCINKDREIKVGHLQGWEKLATIHLVPLRPIDKVN